MTTNTPGVAVVGYGYWGPKLVRNFLQDGSFKQVLVVEDHPDRRARSLKENPSISAVASIEEALGREDITAVALATPVASHYPLAKRALLAGKHVLVEKPLATTTADAEDLVSIATEKGLVLGVDHTYVYHPAVQAVRDYVRTGELGRLAYIDSSRINLGLFQHDVNVLWDLAVHDLSIINTITDERPNTAQAIGVAHFTQDIENIGILILRYASGLFVHINCSWVSPVKLRHMLIGGDKKMIVYDDLNANEPIKIYDSAVMARTDEERKRLMYEYRVGDVYSPRVPQKEALGNLVTDFADAVLRGGRLVSDGRFGADTVKILEATQESVKNGGRQVALS